MFSPDDDLDALVDNGQFDDLLEEFIQQGLDPDRVFQTGRGRDAGSSSSLTAPPSDQQRTDVSKKKSNR